MSSISSRYSHLFKDSSALQIASSRSIPAILLLNYHLKVVFHNKEALEVLNNNPFLFADSPRKDITLNLPQKLIEHCKAFKETVKQQEDQTNFPPLVIQDPEKKHCYCFRLVPAISSESQQLRKYDPYIVIIIEKVIPPKEWIETFNLSKREKEVVEMLFAGYSNKEIADKLFISEYTVEDHIKNLMKKMNVKNRLSVVLKFIESQSTG